MGIGAFPPFRKRAKAHTQTQTLQKASESTPTTSLSNYLQHFIVAIVVIFIRNACAFNMQRRSQTERCKVRSVKCCEHFPTSWSWKSAHHISTRKYLLLRHLAMLTACRCCRRLKNVLFENNVATVYISFAYICLTFTVVCCVCVCAMVHRHKQMYTRCINFGTDLTTDETIPYWVVCKFDRKSCLHLMYTQLAHWQI